MSIIPPPPPRNVVGIKRGHIEEVLFLGHIDCNFANKCILFLTKTKSAKKCRKKIKPGEKKGISEYLPTEKLYLEKL